MKKIILTCLAIVALSTTVKAQKKVKLEDNSNASNFYFKNGSLGLGTNSPDGNLQLGSGTVDGMIFLGGGKGYAGIGSSRSDGSLFLGWNIYTRYNGTVDDRVARVGGRYNDYHGYTGIKVGQQGVIDFFGHSGDVVVDEIAYTDAKIKMRINKFGNVGIGTINPDAKLTVKGKIHAEEVKIDLNVPADYVFQKYYLGTSALKADYVMPTLEEVEAYTKANHHLPEMPSAKQLQEDGLQVGDMVNKLLQKIEELTLYTIEQQKAIKALQFEVTNLKVKNNKL